MVIAHPRLANRSGTVLGKCHESRIGSISSLRKDAGDVGLMVQLIQGIICRGLLCSWRLTA